jgi:hypothetical protein
MPAPRRPRSDETRGVAIVLALVVMLPLGLYRGYAVHRLWNWFAVPLGAPEVGVAEAWGLVWLASLLTQQKQPQDDRPALVSIVEVVSESVLLSTFGLLMGWWLS